jgi:hypothetical protein
MLTKEQIPRLELVQDDIPIVRLTFGIAVYMSEPLTAFRKEVVEAYDRFLSIVGKQGVRQYATQTMTKHKALTPRALSMVPTWFAPDAPKSETYGIELTDAVPFNAAATTKIHIAGSQPTDAGRQATASLVRYVFPASWGIDRAGELLEITKGLCDLLPFRCGYAGYGFEYSKYFTRVALEHAWAQSMHHPGIDIQDNVNDTLAVKFDGIRGVGWLTMIDDAFVKELGGPPKVTLCTTIPVKGGLIIKAGDAPDIGEINRKQDLPAYREAFRYVEPVARRTFERSPWMRLERDGGPRTERWLKRFGDG